MGKPAARMGDTVMTCGDPPAPVGKIVVPFSTVMINGLPAAKQNDMVVGVDIHIVMIPSPGGPIPTPLPHPFNGKLMQQLSMTVKIDGKPAAVLGSVAQNMPPHIPQGGPFQVPPQNKGDVIMGSPTVMIGNGGGGGGGGASGQAKAAGKAGGDKGKVSDGKGEQNDSKGEGHYLDIKVTDKGGFPITGTQYKLKAPDGSISEGALTSQIKRDVADAGDHEITLQTVTKMAWSKKEARSGEKVKAQFETAGYEDGTEAIVTVWAKDLNRPDQAVKTFEGVTISGGKAEVEWTYEWEEDTNDGADGQGGTQTQEDASEDNDSEDGAGGSQSEEQQEAQEDNDSDSAEDPGPGDTDAQDNAAAESNDGEDDSNDDAGSSSQRDTAADANEEQGPQTTVHSADDDENDEFAYSAPKFYFTVTIGNQRVRSPVLEFKDDIELELKDTEGNAVANAAYRVFLPNGEVREGTLDSNGYAKIENVPPGDWDVEFPESGFVME